MLTEGTKRVMEVQHSKKNLAGVLLSGHDGGHADDSLGALQVNNLLPYLMMLVEADFYAEAEVFTLRVDTC